MVIQWYKYNFENNKKNLNKYNKKIIKYLNNFENNKKKREKETISSNIIR